MKNRKIKNAVLFSLVIGLLSIMLFYCKSDPGHITGNEIFNFQASAYPPGDVDTNASDTALAAYAWQEFLALNWKSSYGKDGHKGEPDTSWTFFSDTMSSAPDTVVWETFAHRTELSPYTYPMRPFDSACKYSYQYTPQPGAGSPSYGLFNNLDETSEIGSCNLFAFANAQNLYTDSFIVRYQAKVNKVEYDYIRNNFPTQDSLNKAIANTKRYIQSKYNDTSFTPAGAMLNLPDSSIEIKSAWRLLRANEDASQFFTRNVIVYSSEPGAGDTFTYTNKVYALIGLHIIHKSKNHPSFVFATWEHIGVMQDSMQYILLNNAGTNDSLGYMTPIRNPIPLIDSLSTIYVHQYLLPASSVWQHYRLVGVQGTPTSNTSAPNFFLANYVIESDSLLARFHGSGFNDPFNAGSNVFYNNQLYSVGGCQGCHGGGAQHSGDDFSFIVGFPHQAPDAVAGRPGLLLNRSGAGLHVSKLARLKQRYH